MTRFNVQLTADASPPDDIWLHERLDLFTRFMLPSVRSQTVAPDRWIIFCDSRSPLWFRRSLAREVALAADIVWLDGLFTQARAAEAVSADNLRHNYLITTRVDNDDCISRDYIALIQRAFRPVAREFINLPNGLQYEDRRLYHRWDPSNAFISLVERIGVAPPSTVFAVWHRHAGELAPIRQVRTHPSWIQVVHGGNLANFVQGLRARPGALLSPFQAPPAVDPVSGRTLVADRVRTTVDLAVRLLAEPVRAKRLWNTLHPPRPARGEDRESSVAS